MKKILFLTLGIVWMTTASAQENIKLGVEKQVRNEDTLRIFSVLDTNKEAFLEEIILLWGMPLVRSAGHLEWSKHTIEGVGEDLTILLLDGILKTKGHTAVFTSFREDKEKKKQLQQLSKEESRRMVIEIRDSSGNNLILTPELEQIVYQYLDAILS